MQQSVPAGPAPITAIWRSVFCIIPHQTNQNHSKQDGDRNTSLIKTRAVIIYNSIYETPSNLIGLSTTIALVYQEGPSIPLSNTAMKKFSKVPVLPKS